MKTLRRGKIRWKRTQSKPLYQHHQLAVQALNTVQLFCNDLALWPRPELSEHLIQAFLQLVPFRFNRPEALVYLNDGLVQ